VDQGYPCPEISSFASVEAMLYLGQEALELLGRKLASRDVLGRAMIAINEEAATTNRNKRSMGKCWRRTRKSYGHARRHVSDMTKSQDHSQPRHCRNLGLEKCIALPYFVRQRAIGWRYAADSVRDPGVDQRQTVVRAGAIDSLRESQSGERWKKQVSCDIAGKWPSCAICSGAARRQPNNQKPRVQRPESRNGRVKPALRMLLSKLLPVPR
jgi:hypothetical protein